MAYHPEHSEAQDESRWPVEVARAFLPLFRCRDSETKAPFLPNNALRSRSGALGTLWKENRICLDAKYFSLFFSLNIPLSVFFLLHYTGEENSIVCYGSSHGHVLSLCFLCLHSRELSTLRSSVVNYSPLWAYSNTRPQDRILNTKPWIFLPGLGWYIKCFQKQMWFFSNSDEPVLSNPPFSFNYMLMTASGKNSEYEGWILQGCHKEWFNTFSE